jgi:hypothetical protein
MENDGITWEGIYADIDTLLNGGKPEYREESSRQKGRVIKLKWDPEESADESEVSLTPSEIPGQPILKANRKDRRSLFR